MADTSNPRATATQEKTANPGQEQAKKRPLIDKALEQEIGEEVEHGQLSTDELNSGNDI